MKDKLSYSGYQLIFEEQFDAPRLRREDWNVELHDPGWVNEEWQRYVDSGETICLREGRLLIRPVKTARPDGAADYASGRINTQGKHEFTYGIFEARLKVPQGKGFLPAFWLMAAEEERYGFWPCCGEIDIMEIMGQEPRKNYGTIHYGLPHEQNQGSITLEDGDFAQEFHTFSLEWRPGRLRWYVDGVLYHEAANWYSVRADGSREAFPAPFDHKMYLILNLAVGGSWVGYPDESTDFSGAALEVEFVKVYGLSE